MVGTLRKDCKNICNERFKLKRKAGRGGFRFLIIFLLNPSYRCGPALMFTAQNNSVDVAKLLIQHGAELGKISIK